MRSFITIIATGCVLTACGNELATTPVATTSHSALTSAEDYANATLLPSDFTVYTNGRSVLNWPAPGFEARTLPTANSTRSVPGCYVACYKRTADNAVYPMGQYYVAGQVRVDGSYQARICRPHGYETADISADAGFTEQCTQNISPACSDGSCWAG